MGCAGSKTDAKAVWKRFKSATGLGKDVLAPIWVAMAPILLDHGADVAKNAFRQKYPQFAPLADVLIDELNQRLIEESRKAALAAGKSQAGEFSSQMMANEQIRNSIIEATKAGLVSGAGETFYDTVSDEAYQGAMEQLGGFTGGYDHDVAFSEGGCGCDGRVIGAADLDTVTVRSYADSLNSKTKNKIIEDIVNTGSALGMKITGDTLQAKIKSMLDQIPAGDRFKQSPESHKKTCLGIAKAINNIHGNSVINLDLAPELICQQIAEIVSSLSAGMHTEFLAVYTDVNRVIKNLHVLKSALKEDHAAIVDKIRQSDDSTLENQVSSYVDLHETLTNEIDRQIHLLSNLLNVTLLPSDKELAALIKDKKDIHSYVDSIDVKHGSDKFGLVISNVLKGMGLTANFALVIDRALKTVGMTMDDYAKSGTVSALLNKITQNMMGKNFTDAERHEYLEAAELLYKNVYRSVDIANKIGDTKTGRFEMDYSGGDERYAKTTTDKRILDRKRLRNLLFNAFYKQLNGLFDNFISALDHLTLKVGSEIPLSDQLDGFRDVLVRVDAALVRNKNIYYALIGYYNDAQSQSKKDALLSDLKMVSSYIDTLLALPLYSSSSQYFLAVKSQVNAMSALIERYTEEITAKFGQGEDSDPECQYLERKKAAVDSGEVSGGSEYDDIHGGASDLLDREPNLKYRPNKSVHDAIRQFDYKYRVAKIRANMATTGKELSHYAEHYDKIVSNSIADILEADKKKYEALRAELDDARLGKSSDYASGIPGFTTDKEFERERDAARKFLDQQWAAKQKFWATIEAADTYMRVFTDALVNNPNDIREIKSMLDDIDVHADWYNEDTGNNLVSVFESFPRNINGAKPEESPAAYRDGSAGHYYARVGAEHSKVVTAAGAIGPQLPGNPYLVANPSHGLAARERARRTLNGLTVLKNFLSVFVNIGNKFGGEEIRKKVFMTPSQMYNNLIEYLNASAFAQGWGLGDGDDHSPLGSAFSDNTALGVQLDAFTGDSSDARGLASADSPYAGIAPASLIFAGVASDNAAVYGAAFFSAHDRAVINAANQIMKDKVNWSANEFNEGNPELVAKLTAAAAAAAPAGAAPAAAAKRADREQWPLIGDLNSAKPTNDSRVVMFRKRWGVWMRSVTESLRKYDNFGFNREDEFFVLMMKSMAAKIFTVTGMYDVLDRPMEYNGLTPIRMITGGDSARPKVIDDAVSLYLRLPLLAQFYRNIFGWDDDSSFTVHPTLRRKDQNVKISMLPDIDGTFAGLIRLVFRKTKYDDNSSYTEDDVQEIIREVNLIYTKMVNKYPQNTVMEIIHEFVAEMNRRYSIVSKGDRDEYEREFGYRYDYSVSGTDDRYTEAPETEIAILPGETDDEIERPSGAQRLMGLSPSGPKSARMSDFSITEAHRDLVYKFRCAIDKYFEKPDEEITFNNSIKSTQLKLKHEARDEERFKLVASLVRGADVYSKVDGLKYVMFHETVVSGLNMLSAVHTMLARFKTRVLTLDVEMLEDLIWDYFTKGTPRTDMDKLITYISKQFSDNKICEDSPHMTALLQQVFGIHENHVVNGGTGGGDFTIKPVDGVPVPALGANADRWAGSVHIIDAPAAGTAGLAAFKSKTGKLISHNAVVGPAPDPANLGLVGVLVGYSVEDLREARRQAKRTSRETDASRAADTFIRFVFDREYIMKELIETLFGIGCDFQNLVDVKFDDGKIRINFSGIKATVEDMFQHVKYFMDLLRLHVKPEIMAKYTNKLIPGSYYWLQEQLMEKIILGRPPARLPLAGEPNPRVGYANLEDLVHRINATYHYLTRKWSVDGKGISTATPRVSISATATASHYDKVFANMVFYDASKPVSGLIRSREANDVNGANSINGVKLVDFLHDSFDGLHFSGQAANKIMDTRYAARFHQLYTWGDELTMNRSALFSFNQLIAKFIKTFFDPVSGKMYSNLINQFANGSFNRAVSDQLFTYPDTVPVVHIKYTNPSSVSIPNTVKLLAPVASPTAQTDVNYLKDILKKVATYGIVATDPLDKLKMSQIVSPSSDSYKDWVVAGVKVPNSGSNLHQYMLIHMVATHVYESIHEPVSVTTGLNGRNISIAGKVLFPTGVAAVGAPFTRASDVDIRNTYGTANYETIAYKVAENFNAKYANLFKFKPIGGIYMDDSFKVETDNNRFLADNKVSKVINDYLRHSNQYHVKLNMFKLLNLVMRMFPFRENIRGNTDNEFDYRCELFAALIVRVAEAQNKADKAAFDAEINAILTSVTTVSTTYSSTPAGQPKHLVKYDDAIVSNTEYLSANSVALPSGDVNYFVIPRSDAVGGSLPNDSIKGLGRQNPDPAANPDTIANLTQFGQRQDPDGDHVLFTSLSIILKNLSTSRNVQNQSLIHIVDNIADIPLYMKEKMRANLPVFRNLFKELVARCEFIKKMMSAGDMSLEREYIAGRVPTHNPWPYVLLPVTKSSSDTKTRFMAILDSITRGCQSFISSCDQVLREIGDDPKYFELYQNSIKDYKSQYGIDPLMPLSSTLAVLKNTGHKQHCDLMPVHSLGEDAFKLAYGTRSLLAQPTSQPMLEHNPGFTQMVEQFNLMNDKNLSADKSRIDGFHKTFVKMLRYVNELKNIKGVLTPHVLEFDAANAAYINTVNPLKEGERRNHVGGSFTRGDLILTDMSHYDDNILRAGTATPTQFYSNSEITSLNNQSEVSLAVVDLSLHDRGKNFSKPVYAISKPLSDVIKLTESSFRDDKVKELIQYITEEGTKHNALWIQNIIDLNIVPINVHALMREIPLANLYNYAYTFDRYIIELYYGLKNENARKLIGELCDVDGNKSLQRITSAKDMLVALMLSPHMSVYDNESKDGELMHYNKFAKHVIMGTPNNGELGRPKFLSDQLYNKALFGEMYLDRKHYNELGPVSGQKFDRKLSKAETIDLLSKVLFDVYDKCKIGGADVKVNNDELTNFSKKLATELVKNLFVKITDTNLSAMDRDAAFNAKGGDVTYVGTLAVAVGKLYAWFVLNVVNDINKGKHSVLIQNLDQYLLRIQTITGAVGKTVNGVFGTNKDADTFKQFMISTMNLKQTSYSASFDSLCDNIVNNTFAYTKAALVITNPDPVIKGLLTIDTWKQNDYTGLFGKNQTTKLHWLGTHTDAKDDWHDKGATLQGPRGDNKNVLDDRQIHQSADVSAIKSILAIVGRLRFDTVFIRNIMFVINLYRSVRMKLQRDLTYSKDIVQHSAPITRAQLTEFFGNEVYQAPELNQYSTRMV